MLRKKVHKEQILQKNVSKETGKSPSASNGTAPAQAGAGASVVQLESMIFDKKPKHYFEGQSLQYQEVEGNDYFNALADSVLAGLEPLVTTCNILERDFSSLIAEARTLKDAKPTDYVFTEGQKVQSSQDVEVHIL